MQIIYYKIFKIKFIIAIMSKKILKQNSLFCIFLQIIILLKISCQKELINTSNNEFNLTEFNNFYEIPNNITKSDKLSKMRKLLINKSLNDEASNNSNVPAIIFEIFDSFAFFLYKNNLTDLLEPEEVETCFYDGIIENVKNQELVNIYIDGSGKSLNDFGNEFICNYKERRNVSYMTLHYYIGTKRYLGDKEEFFGQNYFYIGLCLPRKCMNAVKYLIRNKKVLNITHEVGLSNFKVYVNEDVVDLSIKLDKFYTNFILVYILLNIFKIVVGILRIIFLNRGYEIYVHEREKEKIKEKEMKKINDMDSQPESQQYLDQNQNESYNKDNPKLNDTKYLDLSFSFNSEINENIISEGENQYNPFEDKEKNFPTYLKIIKILDFFDNLKILSTNSNKYYNSKDIKNLFIIRFFLMIMCIVHQFMYSQIYLPSKNFYNVEFYSSPFFFLIKLCVNGSTFWITLDAVFFGYKLMSYLKKEIKLSKDYEIDYWTFLKFLLLIIPKFFVFVFAFILLYLYSNRLTFELCKGNNVFSNYLYYNDTIQQMSYSLRNNNNPSDFFKNFIPFRLNYIDFIENVTIERTNDSYSSKENYTSDVSGYEIPSPFLTNTDLFINVYFNEFYLIIIILIITYISYKLKNYIFDLAVLIINVILFILPSIESLNPFKGNIEEQNYTLRYVLGQNYTEKYTHYFINFFYFGFIIGVMKFYLDQNIYYMKKKKKNFINIELPFQFCKKVIIYLNEMKFIIKRAILLLSIFFLLLLSSSFTLSEGKNISYDETINFYKIKGVIKFLFFYEKNLGGILFFIILIMYICYPRNTNIKRIANSTSFIIIERISFCFYTSFCFLIYAQFCLFIMDMQITYPNIFFNTVGMFFIIFIFSIVNTTLLEIPVRQLIKYCMNKNLEKKFLFYYDNNYANISRICDDSSSITSKGN